MKQPRNTGENLELTEEQKQLLAVIKKKQDEEAEKRVCTKPNSQANSKFFFFNFVHVHKLGGENSLLRMDF